MNRRQLQPDDYRVLKGQIDKLRQEAADLERRHTDIAAALKTELAKDARRASSHDETVP